MTGKIVTFYSFKGGTGRSMALANTAWLLASNGYKVLAIDWDLEAPGLHRFFKPFLSDGELRQTPGLIDRVIQYVDLVTSERETWPEGISDVLDLADPNGFAVPLDLPPAAAEDGGELHFISAGRQDEEYAARIRNFDWTSFYSDYAGGTFIEEFRDRLIARYDFVLIDSRTGISDTSGICTVQLPDTVVLCFALNRQNVKGVEAVAQSIREQQSRNIRLLPVAMRVDKDAAGYDDARNFARACLDPLLNWKDGDKPDSYWTKARIPHYPNYAFEEALAILRDDPEDRGTLLEDMVWLTEVIADQKELKVVVLDEKVKARYLRRIAFSDPYVKELNELMSVPPEKAMPRLLEWLKEAESDEEESLEWLTRLTNAAITMASDTSWSSPRQAVELAQSVLDMTGVVSQREPGFIGWTPNASSALAKSLYKLDRKSEALAALEDAVRHVEGAQIAQGTQLHAILSQILLNLGKHQLEMGFIEKSISSLQNAADLISDLNSLSDPEEITISAICHDRLRAALHQADKYEEAVTAGEQAIEAYKILPGTWLEQLDNQSPLFFATLLSGQAESLEALNRWQNAEKYRSQSSEIYENYSQKNPQWDCIHLAMEIINLARNLYEQCHYIEALKLLNESEFITELKNEENKNFPQDLRASCQLYLSVTYYKLDDYKNSNTHFNNYLDIFLFIFREKPKPLMDTAKQMCKFADILAEKLGYPVASESLESIKGQLAILEATKSARRPDFDIDLRNL